MKVIIAGFSKTGTKTVSAALSGLGYVVYDLPKGKTMGPLIMT